MWRSWKNWLAAALCIVTLLTMCVSMVRHRHTGDKSHSHAHGPHSARAHAHHHHAHSHSHAHPHGHAHSHAHGHAHSHSHGHQDRHSHAEDESSFVEQQQGWHLHLTLLGWEVTVWERGVEIVRVPQDSNEPSPAPPPGTTISSGEEWLTAGGSRWHLLAFAFPLLLLPTGRVACPAGKRSLSGIENARIPPQRRERPPVPPPRQRRS